MSYWINRIVIVYSSVNLRRLLFYKSKFDLSIEEENTYSNAEAEFKNILYIEIDYTDKKIRNRKGKPTLQSANKS